MGNAVTQLARALGAKHAIQARPIMRKPSRRRRSDSIEVIDTSVEKLGDGVRVSPAVMAQTL